MTSLSRRQQELALVVLSSFLFLALVAYSYFKIYAPVKETNKQVVLSVANERDLLFALRKQKANTELLVSYNSQPLQRKVPVKPIEDVVLLQISKAEIKSDSLVKDVSFTLSDTALEGLPEDENNVHQMLTEVTLEVESYKSIQKFIDEIERMDRIFIIDSIQFQGTEEIRDIDAEETKLELNLSFSAYYRPDLIDLQNETPKVDAPMPANKVDPMPFNDGSKVGGE
ncbi:LysM peptidoglycan-binding domain-containing protein [Sporosarcina sp. FA9]|uniref:LysM peptidoglycan-binding domain-containing protein n=1 Tax=Sporosarcina sp. FA9 TaxID=3413030 RepID=UPI003F65C9EB